MVLTNLWYFVSFEMFIMTKIMYIDDDKKCKIVQKFYLIRCFKFHYNIAFHFIDPKPTECVADLDQHSEMIMFGSILTTFELSSIFGGSWGSIGNWLEPKTNPPLGILACPNL